MLRLAMLTLLFVGSFALHPGDGLAEPYPSKAIKLIVPQAPGAQNDVLARMLGERLTELWSEPVIVENHGGAGGTIGADLVAKAVPDGYTVLVGGLNNLAVATALWPAALAAAGVEVAARRGGTVYVEARRD